MCLCRACTMNPQVRLVVTAVLVRGIQRPFLGNVISC